MKTTSQIKKRIAEIEGGKYEGTSSETAAPFIIAELQWVLSKKGDDSGQGGK